MIEGKKHKEMVRDYFDGDSIRYENQRYTDEFTNCHQYSYLARKKHVLGLLEEPGTEMLDIGCGPGIYTSELIERNHTVLGLDISPRMIGRAKEKFSGEIEAGKVSFRAGEIFDLGGMDGRFGAVICIGVISYIPEIGKFLDRLFALIRPGGYAVIQISKKYSPKAVEETLVYPSLKMLKGLLTRQKTARDWEFDLRRYTVRRFNTLTSRSGFRLERGVHFDYTLPILNISAKGPSLRLASFLEEHGARLVQSMLAGDYVARYRKVG